ncbi:segregation/condensation protein A [Barrientosiimonas marina]|uniref:Segregation and condensation protein A n=1 Tax=Lentibacillus kimchii TaxID=1542911 RepID=A0ABW2UYM8_9BACI
MNQSYQVKIDAFEGPLDLLLHLINQYEIDIYDIPVSQITEQYMHYIHTMQRLELNVASEYLVMAATLLALKSEMLLPSQEMTEEDDAYMEDPREELMQRLIEYRRYKNAAKQLQTKEAEPNQLFTRSPVLSEQAESRPPSRGDTSIYDMLHALEKMFARKQWDEPLETTVKSEEIPIGQRMNDVLSLVKQSRNGLVFDQLFDYPARSHIVATFIALLELMKNNQVTCTQETHLDDLYVFYVGE